jgi:Transposase DDE domain
MAVDLDTFLTAVYTIVDDLDRERLAAALRHRPGPAPVLSDSEVLTLAICAEWGMWDSERGFWRFAGGRLRHPFPRLVDQSEFNRRRRSLYPALAADQRAVAERLGAHLERERLLDTKPVAAMVRKRHDDRGLTFDGKAAVGWCQTKRQWYSGFKLVLTLTLDGVITRYDLVPANIDDRDAAAEVLEPGCRYRADTGFVGQECRRAWAEADRAVVRAEPPRSTRGAWPRAFAYLAHWIRQLIEVVNAQLQGQFAIERTLAKTLWGLVTRVQAKLTAHTLNQSHGETHMRLTRRPCRSHRGFGLVLLRVV